MKLKESIQAGEKLHEDYSGIVKSINDLDEKFEIEKALKVIMAIDKIKIAERVENISKKLEEKRKQYLEEFETASKECNLCMDHTIMQAKQYTSKEPAGIAAQIEDLIKRYEDKKDDIEQEEKNDIYEELKGHIRFMKKQKK